MLRCFLKRLIDHAIYQLQEGHHRIKKLEKIAVERTKVAYFYTTLHDSAKTCIVAPTGIEPPPVPNGTVGPVYLKFRKLLFYPRPNDRKAFIRSQTLGRSVGRACLPKRQRTQALNYGANLFFRNLLPAADLKYFSRTIASASVSKFSV
jgi:hypothetical protein